MWTGGKPPPVPVTPATATSETPTTTKSYRSERQQTELDQLRQRGLAKLLNKHFTNVTQTLAEERAAADAALADLEARKAAGLKDWDSATGELSVWDKLYLELQQKKANCRRKERETLLLYQRYVDRFGSTGVVAVPRSPTRVVPDARSPALGRDGFEPMTATKVPHLAGQIESNLANMTGAERHPSIKFLGVDETYQKVFADMDQQERVAILRSIEGKGIDARATPPQTKTQMASKNGIPETPNISEGFPAWIEDTPISYVTSTTTSTDPQYPSGEEFYHGELDEDIRSIVSGLTSGDFSDAERILLEFLKTETEAIKKLLDDEEATGEVESFRSSYSSDVHSQSAKAADEAENLVERMQQVLLDFQKEAASSVDDAHEPRRLDTSDPSEDWIMYWDDMAKRHYYYETKSNRAQWAKPYGATMSSVEPTSNKDRDDAVRVVDYTHRSSDRSILLEYDEVSPMDDVPRSSRREKYRRMRRRRRNRRILFVTFVTMGLVGAGLYANRHYHQETIETLTKALGSQEQAEFVVDTIDQHLPDSVTGRLERAEMKVREERARKARLEAERKARELGEKQAQEAREHRAQVAIPIARNPFKEWACQNPHFFFVNKMRGLC